MHYDDGDVTMATSSNFKCPKLDCRTFYIVSLHSERPHRRPRCFVCNTPFLEMDGVQHLQYRPTRDLSDHHAMHVD